MLDEIINYVQSLQRQVEVWKTIYFSPKVEVLGVSNVHLGLGHQIFDFNSEVLSVVFVNEACNSESTIGFKHRKPPGKRCK